jgi:hypothetical protein
MMSLRHLNVRHDIVKSGETYKASLNIKFCYFQIRMLNNDDPQFHRLSIHGNIFVYYVRYVRTLWMTYVDEDIDPLGFILFYGIFACCRISCHSMKT